MCKNRGVGLNARGKGCIYIYIYISFLFQAFAQSRSFCSQQRLQPNPIHLQIQIKVYPVSFPMFCLYSSVYLCVVFMRVCVSAFGLMHIHPCIADFGRWEEKRKMERQNWASVWQSSPQLNVWGGTGGLWAKYWNPQFGFLASGKTTPCKYYIHTHKYGCTHTLWVWG